MTRQYPECGIEAEMRRKWGAYAYPVACSSLIGRLNSDKILTHVFRANQRVPPNIEGKEGKGV